MEAAIELAPSTQAIKSLLLLMSSQASSASPGWLKDGDFPPEVALMNEGVRCTTSGPSQAHCSGIYAKEDIKCPCAS